MMEYYDPGVMKLKTTEETWWIKERDNPQLDTYYVACGQMSKTAAKQHERGGRYGFNTMHSFATEAAYKSHLEELRKQGERVQ